MKELKKPFGDKETFVIEMEYLGGRRKLAEHEICQAIKYELDRLKIKGVVYNTKRYRQIHTED